MSSKTLRMILCAALAAGLSAFGTAAQAIFYDLGLDPFNFEGTVRISVDGSCLTPNGDHSCLIDFISADFTDTAGEHWGSGAPFSEVDPVRIVNGDLFALDATLNAPFLVLLSGGGCDGTQELTFSFDVETGNRSVTFSCGNVFDTGHYVASRVPEPASLALLGLGLAGLAASRRRKLR